MVDFCSFVKWSVFIWWSENQTEKSLIMVQNVWYSNCLGVALPFQLHLQILTMSTMTNINHVDRDKFWYSDSYCMVNIKVEQTNPTSNNLAICFIYFSTLYAGSTTVNLCKISIMQNAHRKFLQIKPTYTNLEKTLNLGLKENELVHMAKSRRPNKYKTERPNF